MLGDTGVGSHGGNGATPGYPDRERTQDESKGYQAQERVDVQHVMRRHARALREEAAAIEDLANALPVGLSRLSPSANDMLVSMFGQAHRVYLGD